MISSSWRTLLFILKTSRPGFWLTSVWFYLLPVGQVFAIDRFTFWLGIFYVAFPLGLTIYGWNDLADAETDRRNPRKDTYLFGAKPDDDQIRALPRYIALVQLPFLVGFTLLIGPQILIWFAAMILVNATYNHPRIGLKRRPFLDMLNQAGYLLVFVLSSWLNEVPQLPWQTFVFGALFAMHSHLFGQIMDIEPDRAAGRRTTAVTIGVLASKGLMVGLLLAEAALVYLSFTDLFISGFLVLGACWFTLDALVLFGERPYPIKIMAAFLLIWNAAALGSSAWVWTQGSLK